MVDAPKAVIYDWDNTIVNTWPVIIGAMNDTLEAMGYPVWTEAEAKARIRHSLREAFPILFGKEWEQARDVFYQSIRRNHLTQLTLLPGADDLTQWLKTQDIPQFVLSNKTNVLLQAEVSHLGWQDRFDHVVGADVAPKDKPSPEAISYTLQHSELSPSAQIWFVGDTAIDMECAHKSALTPVAIRAFEENDPEWRQWSPNFQVETPKDLLNVIKEKLTF